MGFCLSAGPGEQHEAGQRCTLTPDVSSHIQGQTEAIPLASSVPRSHLPPWSLCPPCPVAPCPIGSLGCSLPWSHPSPPSPAVTGMLIALLLFVPPVPCSSVLWGHVDARSPCPHISTSHGVTDMLIPLVPFMPWSPVP